MQANKRSIPELRIRLRQIAEEEGLPELHEIVNEMYRRSPVGVAMATSQSLTPALAAEIRNFAKEHPGMSQQDIGVKFNVNHGRVSEVLNSEA